MVKPSWNSGRWAASAWVVGLIALCLFFGESALAREAVDAQERSGSTATPRPPLNARQVDAFLQEYLGEPISEGAIPGGTVAVVDREGVVLLRGFGTASLANKADIDPEETLFRVGSITKVFTAIAILQLVDRGVLDLDDAVNKHLTSFSVGVRFDQPLTLRHLLTHSAGMDGDVTYAGVASDRQTTIPRDQLARYFRQVYEPGEIVAYDNSAVGLLGLVLEDVYGQSYREIIDSQILEPLGMSKSIIGLPASRVEDAAACHVLDEDGVWKECEHQLLLRDNYRAAGDLSTTAADMAKFMISLLNGTRMSTGRLLSPSSFALLTDMDANRVHPSMHAFGLIPIEIGPVGYGAFGHNGGIRGFKSSFFVSPRDGFGAFLSTNGSSPSITAGPPRPEDDVTLSGLLHYALSSTREKASTRYVRLERLAPRFSQAFLARFGAVSSFQSQEPSAGVTTADDLGSLAGIYVPTISTLYSGLAGRMLLPFLTSRVPVVVDSSGGLYIDGDGPFHPVSQNLFENPRSGARAAIRRAGSTTQIGPHPLAMLVRLDWHQNPWINVFPLLPGLCALFCGGLLIHRPERAVRIAGAGAALGAALVLSALLLELEFASALIRGRGQPWLPMTWRVGFQGALLLIAIAGIAAILALLKHARSGSAGKVPRLNLVLPLICLGATCILLLSAYWGLLGTVQW